MKKDTFIARAFPVNYKGRVYTHTFVMSDGGGSWRCFGRDNSEALQVPGCREIARGLGNTKWAEEICGSDVDHPTGLLGERVDAVCHNVANRILVLAGTEVAGIPGNEAAMLLYGKYGFGVEAFISRLQAAAKRINEAEPGSISKEEIDVVVNRIRVESLSDEIGILGKDFQLHFDELAPSEQRQIQQIYSAFCVKREAEFAAELQEHTGNFPTYGEENEKFQNDFIARVGKAFHECLCGLQTGLGPEAFIKIFKAPPQTLVSGLLG
jgi:hypothetical protein